MSKKKGFTLIELLGVISIMAIIITVSTSLVFTIMKKSKEKISEEMYSSVIDAALTYSLTNFKLQKCSIKFSSAVFERNDISDYENNNSCAKMVSVKTLKDEGFFIDDKAYCDEASEVLVYRYYDGVNSEYKAYVSTDVCNIGGYKICEDPSCGEDGYKTCRNAVCGISYTYDVDILNTCRDSSCGVERYASCPNSNCSCQTYQTCQSYSACGYNSCKNEACGCSTYSESLISSSYATCPSETKNTSYRCTRNSDGTYMVFEKTCTEYRTCQTAACGVASCQSEACGCKTYNSCEDKSCGVSLYYSCESKACGYTTKQVTVYKACATEACGIKYKSCAAKACGKA